MVNCFKRIIIVRGGDLSDFFSLIFVSKMCVFVSRPMNFSLFSGKTVTTQNGLLTFLGKDTFRNKIMEIVEDFDEKSYNNNGKPWKSSRILRVKPNFFFFFIEQKFLIFSFLFHSFHFSVFLHFFVFIFSSSFFVSFFFFSFFLSSFFFNFLFFFFFSSSFLGCSKSDFFGLDCPKISCNIFWSRHGGYLFGPSFFLFFFCYFFPFSFFSFLFISSFFDV